MPTVEKFYRGELVQKERHRLPGEVYNQTRIMLVRNSWEGVFVPIRSMQYQAVIDLEEIIFIDAIAGRNIQCAWREFDANGRKTVNASVEFEWEYYVEPDVNFERRLLGEFSKALSAQMMKSKKEVGGVIALHRVDN